MNTPRTSILRHAEDGSGSPHQRRDVRAYVESARDLDAAELVDLLSADQVERWRQGERIPAEAYLQLHPSLQGDSAAAFELVYGEFVLREHLGEAPTLEEYRWRFPRFADRLQRQLELHRALGAGDDTALPQGSDPCSTVSPAPLAPLSLPRHDVAGYELLGELGRGGMGVVYKARQTSLNRIVALKVIRDRLLASAEEVQRFRSEAEVVARLQHPHIVQIYEVGESAQLSYLVLEYVKGGNLHKKLAGAPQDPIVAARLIETLAHAVHHAHQRGIIHRDLTPANVLLALDGDHADSAALPLSAFTPKISDFGLAKQLEGAPGQTRTGDVVGTPGYMAPEQAQGQLKDIGVATDVWALGAILYELLTGRPPFKGATAVDTLVQLANLDPVAPRQLRPDVPRDLETICLKCLEKAPHRRYTSAADLADDLRRALACEPIRARPTPGWERAWKWARRRPVVAALSATVLLTLALGFVLVSWQWGLAEERARAEGAARADAQGKERRERQARRELERLSAGVMLDQGAALCGQGEVAHGLLVLARGLELAERARDADLERVARLNLAVWRQQLVHCRAVLPHGNIVMAAAYSPTGRTVLTCSHDGTARQWEVESGKPVGAPMRHREPPSCVAYAPDGKRLLTGAGAGAGEARLWDAQGKPLGPVLVHASPVNAVAFSAQGDLFLTVTPQQAQVWKTATCQPMGPPLRPEKGGVWMAVFSPDGKRVLTGGGDGQARLWDAHTSAPVGKPLSHNAPVFTVAFSPDGKALFTGTALGVARLWDADTRQPLGLPMYHRGPVRAVAFSADGQLLATGGIPLEPDPETNKFRPAGGEACLWERTGKRIGQPLPHPAPVWAVALSPDARILLTGAEDGAARLFRVGSGAPLGRPLGGEGTVRTVAFAPDGRTVLIPSAGGDRHAAARLWELPPGLHDCTPLDVRSGTAAAVAFSRDGKAFLTGHDDGTARLWDVATRRTIGPLLKHGATVSRVAFSPDGRILLTAAEGKNTVHLWDRVSGQRLRDLATAGLPLAAVFSPDGKTVLTGDERGAQFWETATGERRGAALAHPKPVCGVGFAADGRKVWTACRDDMVRQWDCETRQVVQLWRSPAGLKEANFSTAGVAALSYNEWRYAQLRKLTVGQKRSPLVAHPGPHEAQLAFAADGLLVASAGSDGTARLWDAATGKAIGPPLPHRWPLRRAVLRADGRLLAVAGTATVALWRVPGPVQGTPARVRLWAEIVTGLELDEQGAPHELSPEALGQRRRELEQLGGPPTAPEG